MGDVSCQVQNYVSWVITGFDNIVASSSSPLVIMVQGLLDMPTGAIPGISLTDELIISAYQTQHPTDVYNNALLLARTYSSLTPLPAVTGPFPGSCLTINLSESMELDEIDYVHNMESKPLRAGHVGPLKVIHDHSGFVINVGAILQYRLRKWTVNDQNKAYGRGFRYNAA